MQLKLGFLILAFTIVSIDAAADKKDGDSKGRWYVSTWAERVHNKATGSTHPLFGPTHYTTEGWVDLAKNYIAEYSKESHEGKEDWDNDRLEVVGCFLTHERQSFRNVESDLRVMCSTPFHSYKNKDPDALVGEYYSQRIPLILSYLKSGNEQHLDKAEAVYLNWITDTPLHPEILTYDQELQHIEKLKSAKIPLRHAYIITSMVYDLREQNNFNLYDTPITLRKTVAKDRQMESVGYSSMLTSGDVTELVNQCNANAEIWARAVTENRKLFKRDIELILGPPIEEKR